MGARKAADHLHDLGRRLRVEVAGGLVGEHHARPRHEGARDAHALLLAARHLAGEMVGSAAQAHAGEHLACQRLALALGHAAEGEGQRHVFGGGQRRQEVVGLEDKPQVLLAKSRELVFVHARDGRACDVDAAARRFLQARELVEQRGLARARGAEDAADLSGHDVEVDALERHHGVVCQAIFLAQAAHLDDRVLAGVVHARLPQPARRYPPCPPFGQCRPL